MLMAAILICLKNASQMTSMADRKQLKQTVQEHLNTESILYFKIK